MPKRQLMKVIEAELGPNWQDRLKSFDAEPIASASIGQACFFLFIFLRCMSVVGGEVVRESCFFVIGDISITSCLVIDYLTRPGKIISVYTCLKWILELKYLIIAV